MASRRQIFQNVAKAIAIHLITKIHNTIAMKLFENLERIKKMNRLIKSGHSGAPTEFALTMGISQSHLFRSLNELQQYGLDIQYSRSMKTYFYGNDKELAIDYSVKIISNGESKDINGGMSVMVTFL
jgi:hypothetical protein